jgi:zinc protease
MTRKQSAALLVLICAVMQSSSWADNPSAPGSPSKVTNLRLQNGLRVHIEEHHRVPLVAMTIAFAVGASREGPGTYGFAHLFEHMTFMGTEHISKDQHDRMSESVGALEDATTSFDMTQYYTLVPSAALENLVWLESDRMGFLVPALTEAHLQAQKNDVLNELRQITDRPYGRADRRLVELAFPSPHPYFGNVAGREPDINAATLAALGRFFTTYYVPANAFIVIVGDVSAEKVRPLLEKYFGSLPAGRPPASMSAPMVPRGDAPVREGMDGDAPAPRVSVAWRVPPAFTGNFDDDVALDILAIVLGDKRFGAIANRMMRDQPLLVDVACENDSRRLGGLFHCDLTLQDGASMSHVEAAFDRVLADLARHPPSDLLEAARVAWRARRLREDQNYLGRARSLAWYAVVAGDPARADADATAHDLVTPAAIGRVIKQHLLVGRRYVVTATPRGNR